MTKGLTQISRAGNPKRRDLTAAIQQDRLLKQRQCFETPRSRGVGTLRVGRPAGYLPSGTVGQWPPATGQWWTELKGGDPRTDQTRKEMTWTPGRQPKETASQLPLVTKRYSRMGEVASAHKREGDQGPKCAKGRGPKDPGVTAPLVAAGCRGNCWCDALRHRTLAHVSVLVSSWTPVREREGGRTFPRLTVNRSMSEFDILISSLGDLCFGTPCDCGAPQLNVFCQFDFALVPVDSKHCATVLPSSMTVQSNFEDVPFWMLGRTCQDDSFVSSVDNIKTQVAPFVFLVRHGVSVASGRLLNLGYATVHPFFEKSYSFTNHVLAQHHSLRYWFAETARCESGVIAPSCTRCGDHRLSPGTCSFHRCQVEWDFIVFSGVTCVFDVGARRFCLSSMAFLCASSRPSGFSWLWSRRLSPLTPQGVEGGWQMRSLRPLALLSFYAVHQTFYLGLCAARVQ